MGCSKVGGAPSGAKKAQFSKGAEGQKGCQKGAEAKQGCQKSKGAEQAKEFLPVGLKQSPQQAQQAQKPQGEGQQMDIAQLLQMIMEMLQQTMGGKDGQKQQAKGQENQGLNQLVPGMGSFIA